MPKAQGIRCGVWGGGSAHSPEKISISDLKWADFGANLAFCTVHLKAFPLETIPGTKHDKHDRI